jgi:hypothetical protein
MKTAKQLTMTRLPRLSSIVLLVASITTGADPAFVGTWPAGLQVERAGEFPHAWRRIPSSSSLRARWAPPSRPVSLYVLVAVEARSAVQVETTGVAREVVFTDLKAATSYDVYLRACLDPRCAEYLEADPPARAETEAEYWAIQGHGSGFENAARLVADGNVGSHAFVYGPWAGPELDGRIQLYYTPLQRDEKGVKLAEQVHPADGSIEAASAFRGVSGYGLLRICQPLPGPPGGQPTPDPACAGSRSMVTNLALYQAVPLTPEAGGKVRLYFEAEAFDGRTRIHYLDSQDGYLGRDFHRGRPTRCETDADYSPGGGCEPTLAIGVDLDGARGNPNLRNARQFKIGYPTLESWAWDMRPGTFMWFTTEWADWRCSPYGFNFAYAVWDGARWQVDSQPDGCPRLLAGAQAPAPVHLGGGRYKLYFNRHPHPAAAAPGLPLKPVHVLYADARSTSDPMNVEFDDWEPREAARKVHYLWPDGGALSLEDESTLDDYFMFAPTRDPRRLIMYTNLSRAGGGSLPFLGSAVLINP